MFSERTPGVVFCVVLAALAFFLQNVERRLLRSVFRSIGIGNFAGRYCPYPLPPATKGDSNRLWKFYAEADIAAASLNIRSAP
jgi:hypothetical protein